VARPSPMLSQARSPTALAFLAPRPVLKLLWPQSAAALNPIRQLPPQRVHLMPCGRQLLRAPPQLSRPPKSCWIGGRGRLPATLVVAGRPGSQIASYHLRAPDAGALSTYRGQALAGACGWRLEGRHLY
jgi:hypothetical protein